MTYFFNNAFFWIALMITHYARRYTHSFDHFIHLIITTIQCLHAITSRSQLFTCKQPLRRPNDWTNERNVPSIQTAILLCFVWSLLSVTRFWYKTLGHIRKWHHICNWWLLVSLCAPSRDLIIRKKTNFLWKRAVPDTIPTKWIPTWWSSVPSWDYWRCWFVCVKRCPSTTAQSSK